MRVGLNRYGFAGFTNLLSRTLGG